MDARPNIVLVHGAWADGSCWSSVIERLQADGYHVTAPQLPMTALADDVARLRQVLDLQDGPTIVAAHSYGGQIPTALGTDACRSRSHPGQPDLGAADRGTRRRLGPGRPRQHQRGTGAGCAGPDCKN